MDGRAGVGALALAALLGSALAAAEPPSSSLALSPPTLSLSAPPLVPGETRIARLTVFNSGDEAVNVTTAGAEPAGAWITAVPAAFHLPLDGSQEVTLRIDVPRDAAKGVHLGRIDFLPASGPGGGDSQVVAGVSGLLDILVDPTVVHDLKVERMGVANVHVGDPLPVEAKVRNRGNVQDAYRLELVVQDVARTTVHLRTSFDSQPLTAGDERADRYNASVALPEGQYAYTLTATLLGAPRVLRTEEGLFQVAPPGAKFKLGALPLLSLAPAQPQAGDPVRVVALFRNEGVVDFGEVRFVGTVLRDGTAIASFATAPVAVGAQRNASLEAAYTPEEPGAYLVRGHAVYDGLVTEEREAAFEVAAASGWGFLPGLHIAPWVWTPLGLILLLLGLLGLLGLWRRSLRKGKDKRKEDGAADPGKPASGPTPAWLRTRPDLPAPAAPGRRRWGWFLFRRGAVAPPAVPAPTARPPRGWLARTLAWLRRAPRRLVRRGSGAKPSGSKGTQTDLFEWTRQG